MHFLLRSRKIVTNYVFSYKTNPTIMSFVGHSCREKLLPLICTKAKVLRVCPSTLSRKCWKENNPVFHPSLWGAACSCKSPISLTMALGSLGLPSGAPGERFAVWHLTWHIYPLQPFDLKVWHTSSGNVCEPLHPSVGLICPEFVIFISIRVSLSLTYHIKIFCQSCEEIGRKLILLLLPQPFCLFHLLPGWGFVPS